MPCECRHAGRVDPVPPRHRAGHDLRSTARGSERARTSRPDPRRLDADCCRRHPTALTPRLPSDLFLWAAVGAVAISAALQATDRRDRSLFVGQWVPTILLLGVYNKIVKVSGHDRADKPSHWY